MPIIVSFNTKYFGRKYFVQVCLQDPEWINFDIVCNLHQALAHCVILGENMPQPTSEYHFKYTTNHSLVGRYYFECDEDKDAKMRARREPRHGEYDYDFNYQSDSDLELPVFNLLGDIIECDKDIIDGFWYDHNWCQDSE